MSHDIQITNVKQMSVEMPRTRLKPVFSLAGDLIIIVPGISEEAAKEQAGDIARRLSSAGKWGADLADLGDLGVIR
ncbi:MAG: hypothetical protein WAO19_05360 [Candidatus Kryptoniota bacterium]